MDENPLTELRPRRSVLYLPGSNARALQKARNLAADGLILDLEDAVAPVAKTLARRQIAAALEQGGYGRREVIVRVNGLDSPWGKDDLETVAKLVAPIDAVLLPKVESAQQVQQAAALLDAKTALWLMIETPRAILDIDAVIGGHEGVQALVMGTSDLAKELRVPPTPGRTGLITVLSRCVLAARAHGLDILDGVYLDLDDADERGLLAACEQGRDLGFDGKTLIHPKQIDTANRVFAPTQQSIDSARRIIEAWQKANSEDAGVGVIVLDGRLVERLHVLEAQRILALAEAISRV